MKIKANKRGYAATRWIVFALVATLLLSSASIRAQEFEADPWLEDFHQLLAEMSSHYANLEWAANERRMDLPKLKATTERRIRQARSTEDAHRAFERFLKSFGDGHIEIHWQPRANGSGQASGGSFCDRMGYNEQEYAGGGIDWSIFPEFTPVHDADSADVPGGLLRVGKRTVGVIRIGLFDEHAHPALCREAQKKLGKPDDAQCSGACEDRFQYAVGDLLTAALERRLRRLRAAGADTILVDITGNGGGTSFVEPAARVLTSIKLKSPRSGLVKHPHSVRELEDRLRDVEADVMTASASERTELEQTVKALRVAIAEASTPCDRSILWSEPPSALHCSQIVKVPPRTSAEAAPYKYDAGANRLPVLVLIDGNTGSSAEWFAAMLQDNHAATLVGQITAGAGCGFTDGGIPTVLKKSGAQVRLPDCVRFRADGSDEVSGVTPDVLLPWVARYSRYQESAMLKRWVEAGMPGLPKHRQRHLTAPSGRGEG